MFLIYGILICYLFAALFLLLRRNWFFSNVEKIRDMSFILSSSAAAFIFISKELPDQIKISQTVIPLNNYSAILRVKIDTEKHYPVDIGSKWFSVQIRQPVPISTDHKEDSLYPFPALQVDAYTTGFLLVGNRNDPDFFSAKSKWLKYLNSRSADGGLTIKNENFFVEENGRVEFITKDSGSDLAFKIYFDCKKERIIESIFELEIKDKSLYWLARVFSGAESLITSDVYSDKELFSIESLCNMPSEIRERE